MTAPIPNAREHEVGAFNCGCERLHVDIGEIDALLLMCFCIDLGWIACQRNDIMALLNREPGDVRAHAASCTYHGNFHGVFRARGRLGRHQRHDQGEQELRGALLLPSAQLAGRTRRGLYTRTGHS